MQWRASCHAGRYGSADRTAKDRETERGALGVTSEADRHGEPAWLRYSRTLRQRAQRGEGDRCDKVSRPEEPRKYLDRPRAHAALDGGRDQGRESEERGLHHPLGETNLRRSHRDGTAGAAWRNTEYRTVGCEIGRRADAHS